MNSFYGIQIIKYLKENGYIISLILDQYSFEIFFDKEKIFTHNVKLDNYEPSIKPIFCVQNYFGF